MVNLFAVLAGVTWFAVARVATVAVHTVSMAGARFLVAVISILTFGTCKARVTFACGWLADRLATCATLGIGRVASVYIPAGATRCLCAANMTVFVLFTWGAITRKTVA